MAAPAQSPAGRLARIPDEPAASSSTHPASTISSAGYFFSFTVTRAAEATDGTGARVVYYCYRLEIRRLDADGITRTHCYPPAGSEDSDRYRRRWSAIDAFDAEWGAGEKKADGSNPLHDQLRLDPHSLSKWSSPLKSQAAVKQQRMKRFAEYINAMMTVPALHRAVAKFLQVPLEILAPPAEAGAASPAAASSGSAAAAAATNGSGSGAAVAAAASGESGPAVAGPLSYTRRKVKRAKVLRDVDEEDEGAAVDAGGAAVAPLLDASGNKINTKSQFSRDGKTPNPHWSGPSAADWQRLAEIQLLKLPHSGFFSKQPKVRRFALLSLEDSERARQIIAGAVKHKKSNGAFDAVSPKAFVLTWDSSKSDLLDTFFVLGDANIPWTVCWDQSAGEFAKAKKDATGATPFSARAATSLTLQYAGDRCPGRDSIDLIAESDADYKLLQSAITYIAWKEEGKVTGARAAASP